MAITDTISFVADLPPPSPGPPAAAKRPRWPAITWRVLTLVAIGLAVGCWFRPVPHDKPAPTPTYTEQQITDAKTDVCAAFYKVAHALDIAANQKGGSDPTSTIAVATAARQAFEVSGRYLLTKLAADPATPPDLAEAVRKLATSYQELAIDYLDGLTNSDAQVQPSLDAGTEAASSINGICK